MPYQKRRIVEVPFFIDGEERKHPGIIISTPEVHQKEGFYYCVMITSSTYIDQFSYILKNYYLDVPLEKPSQVRSHIITEFFEDEIMRDSPENYITESAFEGLMRHINENTFGYSISL